MNLPNVNAVPFRRAINDTLSANLTAHAKDSLAGLLALDYVARLESTPQVEEHASWCASNLKAYLKQKVVTDDSFATNMMLFSIAIAPARKSTKDDDNLLSQLSSNEHLVDTIIEMYFGDLSVSDKKKVKIVIQGLIAGKDGAEILNLISSNPKLVRGMVADALLKYQTQKEINRHVTMEINKILGKAIEVNKKISKLKQQVSKITTAASFLAVATMGLVVPAVSLPFLAVPAAIGMIKYSPKLGNKIGTMLAEKDASVKEALSNVEKIKTELQGQYQAYAEEVQKQRSQVQAKDTGQIKETAAQVDFTLPEMQVDLAKNTTLTRVQTYEMNKEKAETKHHRINTSSPNERGRG